MERIGYRTVMTEKTSEQSAVKISRNTPHCTVFQLSSKVRMNLYEKCKMKQVTHFMLLSTRQFGL
jgi:hypothetical protein